MQRNDIVQQYKLIFCSRYYLFPTNIDKAAKHRALLSDTREQAADFIFDATGSYHQLNTILVGNQITLIHLILKSLNMDGQQIISRG